MVLSRDKVSWGMKPFLSSRDPETPPHLEPELYALVRRNGPLPVGLAGLTCLCPDLPSSCSAQEAASSSPGRAWGGAPQALLCLCCPVLLLPCIMLAGWVRKHGAGEAEMTVSVPTPGLLQRQTSASPRSYIPTFSAWASACPYAEVSCSFCKGWWAGGCRGVLLQVSLPSLGQGAW